MDTAPPATSYLKAGDIGNQEYDLTVGPTRERITAESIAGLVVVFVDYGLVGTATAFPLDLSGHHKPKLTVGARFLATGDSVPTYVATVTESLGDSWVMVRLDDRVPTELDCY